METFDDLPGLEDDDLFETDFEDEYVVHIDKSFKEQEIMSDVEDKLMP